MIYIYLELSKDDQQNINKSLYNGNLDEESLSSESSEESSSSECSEESSSSDIYEESSYIPNDIFGRIT